MERLVVEAVVVDPERVASRLRGERPIDRGLPTALRVPLEVIGEEVRGLAEVVAERLHAEDFAGFEFNRLGRRAALFAGPDDFHDLPDASLDVEGMICVIDEDPIPGDVFDRICSGHVLRAGRQALCVLQLARRADRQRCERVGQLWCGLLAGRIPDVPTAKDNANQVAHNFTGRRTRLPFGYGKLQIVVAFFYPPIRGIGMLYAIKNANRATELSDTCAV
ncbi:MAG: hypothetical protein JW395_0118 [Nitrospira sp.]|nr:hypothetical protein [Nitrospira sp.]